MISSSPLPFSQGKRNDAALPFLLAQACDPQRTPGERATLFKSIFDRLPARDATNASLHAQCLNAMLTPIDPVERRALLGHYHQRHPFPVRSDNTHRLFLLVSKLQKPEHRSTEHAWGELSNVCSPGRSTNWPVWRELCRVLATQMAPVIQTFQQSGESPANKRRFNELVLRVLLRLAAPANSDSATASQRQFDLLSDLMQAIPAEHRASCLRWLETACADWVEAEMKKRGTAEKRESPPREPMPIPELALLAALRLLRERHGDPAPGPSAHRLSDSRAESAVQDLAKQLRQGHSKL